MACTPWWCTSWLTIHSTRLYCYERNTLTAKHRRMRREAFGKVGLRGVQGIPSTAVDEYINSRGHPAAFDAAGLT